MTQPLEFLLLPDNSLQPMALVGLMVCSIFSSAFITAGAVSAHKNKLPVFLVGVAFAVAGVTMLLAPWTAGIERMTFLPGKAKLFQFDGELVTLSANDISDVSFQGGRLVFVLNNGSRVATQSIPESQQDGIMQAVTQVFLSEPASRRGGADSGSSRQQFTPTTILEI